jgi:hypothetical protein
MQDQTKQYPHTLGNAYGFHKKKLAGKAIRKSMKTKGEKFAVQTWQSEHEAAGREPLESRIAV